jgi:hypothetical protein
MKMPKHDIEDNHSNDSNNNHFTVLVFFKFQSSFALSLILDTGHSLSDQHILSPINRKYDD